MGYMMVMQTVAKTLTFIKQAEKLLSDDELKTVVDYLAFNPEVGDVIQGTGGIRKVRFALPGRGKSGGARVIYYYHSEKMPLYALSIYAKNTKTDLNADEKKAAKALIKQLKGMYNV